MKFFNLLPITLALLLSSAVVLAEENSFGDCSSGWRSFNKDIVRGEGQANISLQCRKDEKPCPPKDELIRRAKLVANAYALANIRSKIETEVSHKVEVVDGVGRDQLTMKAGGKVFQIAFCTIKEKGVIKTLAWGETE